MVTTIIVTMKVARISVTKVDDTENDDDGDSAMNMIVTIPGG